MMKPAAPPAPHPMRFGGGDLGLWATAAVLVFSAHVAIAYAVQGLDRETDGGPPPAQTIEIASIAITPAEQAQVATLDATQPDQSEPMPLPLAKREDPMETSETEAEQSATVAPDEAEPVHPERVGQLEAPPGMTAPEAISPEVAKPIDALPPEVIVPDPVEAVAPEVAVPLPRPKPVELADVSSKPVQPKAKPSAAGGKRKPMDVKANKRADKPKTSPRRERAAAKPVEAAGTDAQPAARTAAPNVLRQSPRAGSSSGWESRLHGWIARHTRYPNAARAKRAAGQPYVVMTLDVSGRVLSARLFRSSGNDDLDGAALSALRGATVPAPPPDRVGTPIVAPFTFVVRR
jgi:protein TonB